MNSRLYMVNEFVNQNMMLRNSLKPAHEDKEYKCRVSRYRRETEKFQQTSKGALGENGKNCGISIFEEIKSTNFQN